MALTAPRPAGRAPRRSPIQWGGFVHMLARFYINYTMLVMKASRRRRKRAVDVDGQKSKDGTSWALHWATVGKNKLHDPRRRIGKNIRIDHLTDDQIEVLRGPKGQRPQKLHDVLRVAYNHNVRVEVETKVGMTTQYLKWLFSLPWIQKMDARGDLQFKTLAWMGDPIDRLKPIHDHGGTTVLSFTGFGRRKGISKRHAWPAVDFVRGKAKWVA